jgi:hypothetical protein
MGGLGKAVRRLAVAGAIALALTAAGAVVAPDPDRWGWGQPAAARLAPAGRVAGRPGDGWLPASLPDDEVPAGAARPVLGVLGYKPAVLAWLDPLTLRPLPGPRVRLRYGIAGYGWSPDRSLLVLGDIDDDALHLVDPVRMRRLATIDFGIVAEAPQEFAWLGPRRLAVVAGNSGDGSTLVMVDPVARRVLSRRQLAPANLTVAPAGDRLVLLRAPLERIGPVQLQVVDDRGRMRTARLEGIHAGFQNPPDWDRPGAYAIDRSVGLAVDPEGGRAFVVAADAPVAEVDLASLRVTYRHLRQPASLLRRLAHWLVPPAGAKLSAAGSWRGACWIGDGVLAVAGGDSRIVGDTVAEQRVDRRPSGLKLVDTRSWTVRTLDPAVTSVSWRAGRLVSTGGTWDFEAQRERGAGVTLYGPGDRPPRHLLGTRTVWDAYLNGDLVYADLDTGTERSRHLVVSLRSGQVLASSDTPLPFLLLGERDQYC